MEVNSNGNDTKFSEHSETGKGFLDNVVGGDREDLFQNLNEDKGGLVDEGGLYENDQSLKDRLDLDMSVTQNSEGGNFNENLNVVHMDITLVGQVNERPSQAHVTIESEAHLRSVIPTP
ncbi:hypothetical protein CIPAW_03G194400 [Carya illinoinensis]|uniref:Uncharacterized protein n=1 Tax=Carya illinoinensis TaxID=32201 RepID=A0A8T1R4J6_CARIL|nr:hypothetical protein CIPAW_03G194400 [Carya illinoinensis]